MVAGNTHTHIKDSAYKVVSNNEEDGATHEYDTGANKTYEGRTVYTKNTPASY